MAEEYEVRGIPSYTKEDTWAKVIGDGAVKVGITDYAQKMLSEITYVDLPEVGSAVVQLESFGSAESSKSVADIYSPISGIVVAVNQDLADDPEMINRDPYDAGWIIEITPSNLDEELKNLLSADEYKALIKEKTS
ncbi:glycine cleavage system protein GcvH [Acetobacterium fimetarium]|jgi:glycine cleavage system H protein|uniref:Glycine cleavage system H protein n=1 Tax=Acetobacterium fimetarium TaxID=52691 RepID=A0ABR6WS46_9FIRM|nr:glycine cleavage system protein GcvH [Acetobacterium fimetarium]MBC3803381.1 glycine cleavage system protein GcvH [Acetobacterium fimetarium]MBU4541411.1 glycine cleavage system protein GcvH [Bacillota bacterium]